LSHIKKDIKSWNILRKYVKIIYYTKVNKVADIAGGKEVEGV